MGWIGMVASGSGFLAIGVCQAVVTISSYLRRRTKHNQPHNRTPPKRLPFSATQLSIIAALAFLHIVSGLVASQRERSMADSVGMGVPLERSGVALVFFLYAITALVSEKTSLLPLPWEALQLFAVFAFGQEFLLFYLQRGDAGLESRYYILLLVPIGACLITTALEIAYPHSALLPLVRSMALVLQGTWFFQMAVSLFSGRLIAEGCELKMNGEDDYTIACKGMALMRGRALATLQFNCHMALLLIFFLPVYSTFSRKYNTASNNETPNYERLQNGDTYELKGIGQEASGTQHSPFSLDLEEEDTRLDGRVDGNGFHSLAI